MRIDVSDPLLCGCDTCVHHRTLCMSNTQETEPSSVVGSSVPVSSGPVQALGSTSDQTSSPIRSGTEPPPVTTSVNPEPAKAVISTRFEFPPVSSEPAQALAPTTPSGSMQGTAFGFSAFAAHRPSLLGASATSAAPPVSSAPVQALGITTTSSSSFPVHSSSPTVFTFPPAVSSEPAQAPLGPAGSLPGPVFGCSSPFAAPVTNIFGSGASAASVPSMFGTMQAPAFGSGSSSPYASSTSSPFEAPSPLRWGSMQAPVQANGPSKSTPFSFLPAQDSGKTASAFPPPFGYPARPDVGLSPRALSGCFGENHFSSPFGPTQDFARSGVVPKNPFGSFLHPGFRPSNRFGPNPQTSSSLAGVGTEEGSRYPRYAPTPDLTDSVGGKMIISISASNSHGRKSHEELRWEDYNNGDKGGFGWFPPAHTLSSFAPSPSIPDHPHRTTQGNMTGFPFGYTIPTAVQRPHEPAGVSSPASGGCTACGATSSSSPSGHLGLNGTTNPPSSLPGLYLSTYGSFPLLFGTPNLAAYGTATTIPAVQAYAVIFGTNFTSQGITTTPAVQAYPMMFGTPNLAGQGTTTPAVQFYPTMFGAPNLAGQSTTTTPAVQPYPLMFRTPNLAGQGTTTTPAQPYPMMFGTPNLAGQGTSTTPAVQPYRPMCGTRNLTGQGTTTTPPVQPYPMMFGTPNIAGQGSTTTTPLAQPYPTMSGIPNLAGQGTTSTSAAQPYPMMFGTPNLAGQGTTTTTPAVQPYAIMFGTPNLGAQSITQAAQAYPVHDLTLPFATMSLQ